MFDRVIAFLGFLVLILLQAAQQVQDGLRVGNSGAALYRMVAQLPDKQALRNFLVEMMNIVYSPPTLDAQEDGTVE